MLKSRTTNAALRVLLGATLCASLVPLDGAKAYADNLIDDEGTGIDLAAEAHDTSEPDLDGTSPGVSSDDLDAADLSLEEPREYDVDRSDEGQEPTGQTGTAVIVREGKAISFESVNAAINAANDGETVVVSGAHVLDAPVEISDGKSVTLRSEGSAKMTRADAYPQSGEKPAALVKLSKKSSLTIESDSAESTLSLDGERKDSNEAVIVVDGESSLTMGQGAVVENAYAAWKPWGGVYVRNGSFVLDGGKIVNGFAQRNAAVAVEAGSSFDMRSGEISNNRSTYSEATVWAKGSFTMSGGSIVGNLANSGASRDGVVYILGGGSFAFTGGTIGKSSVSNSCGVYVDNSTISIGSSARMTGSDRIVLKGSSHLDIASDLTGHDINEPLPITLLDAWDAGRVVAKFASPEAAHAGVSCLSAITGDQAAQSVPLLVDPEEDSWVSVASGDVAELFDLLDNPYADNLGLVFKDAFSEQESFTALRARLDAAYDGIETPDKRQRYDQLSYIERQLNYVDDNREAVEASVLTLSSLGDADTDRNRTRQNFQFDNLDATGYYLKPGVVNELYLYVDADDPSLLSLGWRQAGRTENSSYTSLGMNLRTQLKNGVNRVVVDLTDKQYGYMLFMRNDSTSNSARVRLEGADANKPGNPLITGTQLGAHPVYLHDTDHPERFWDFVQEVRAHAALVSAGTAQDMALLQMGDEGRAQFSIRATALASAYAGIDSLDAACSYIERSNEAIQERLEFFWAFDGFDASEQDGANAVSRMRVHTAFTINVSSPSSMYATGRYFHMPEGTAASFLCGESMYGWGMSHEYGHVLDNTVLVINEETNNMYSIAGARNGELLASESEGRAFSPSKAYHPNILRAESLWDTELQRMAGDPSYTPDWNDGGWGYYIWAHVLAWWNGTHFFDDWDYADYDYDSSPFSETDAQAVGSWGAFGATMRILRADAEAVSQIEQTTSSIADGTSRKYNRIAMAYTMGTGYDFAEYLETMGQQDLTDEVKAFCGQYPSMPRKVQYYSLSADAAQINGAAAYEGSVRPQVSIESSEGVVSVKAEMPTSELAASTVAYELYRKGELVGFSRTGSFSYALTDDFVPGEYSVVSYDARLNPSQAAYAPGEGPEAALEELNRDIEAARDRMGEMVFSTDGTDVSSGAQWATLEAMTALQAAIDAAQEVARKEGLTVDDIANARTLLAHALAVFNAEVKVKPALARLTIVAAGDGQALEVGSALQLTAVCKPEGSNLPVTWRSSEETVATVGESGLVSAVSEGTAVITATASNGVSATYDVTVVGTTPGQPAPEPPAEDNPPTPEQPDEDDPSSPEQPGEGDSSMEEPPVPDSPESEPWVNPYEDMQDDDWFYDDVRAMWERGIMTGIGGTSLFDPYGTTTRAMAVSTIWRMAGMPSTSSDATFSDVREGEWFAEAVRWAASVGVTTGYGDTGLFGPEDSVTREQFATMLKRYASVAGLEPSQSADLSRFPDAGDVSEWGAEGLAWAVGAGIIRGANGTHLMPTSEAQRCELAAMLNRCVGLSS